MRIFATGLETITRAPDGMAAAAAVAAPAAAAPAAAPAVAASAAAAPAAAPAADAKPADAKPAVYLPDGLPEAYKGATEKEIIDKLYGKIKDLPAAPVKADDYTITSPDLLKIIDPKSDPVLPLYRGIAHELGMSQMQFEGSISKLYAKMGEAGLLQAPIDLNAEFAALSDGKGDRSAQIAAGQRATLEAKSTIDGLVARGQLDKDLAAELTGPMFSNARSIKAITALLALGAVAGGLQPGGTPPQSNDQTNPEATLRRMYPSMYPAA